MKYCNQCGNQLMDEAVVCPRCGCAVGATRAVNATPDVPSTGLNILAFLFPLIGLILYLVDKDKTPVKSKEIGKWALIGFIVSIVLGIISGIISGCAVLSYMTAVVVPML